MNNFSIIVGIKSFSLSKEEKNYLKKFKPLGVILFNRNVLNKKQVISLIKEIKDILGSDCLVMIDQEGGKVSRLRKEIWPEFPAANVFGLIAENNLKKAKKKHLKTFI